MQCVSLSVWVCLGPPAKACGFYISKNTMKTKEELLKDWEVDGKRDCGVHKPTGIKMSAVIWENDKITKISMSGNFSDWEDNLRKQGKIFQEIHSIVTQLKDELEVLLLDYPSKSPDEMFLDALEDGGMPSEKLAKIKQMLINAGGTMTAEILKYILKGKLKG